MRTQAWKLRQRVKYRSQPPVKRDARSEAEKAREERLKFLRERDETNAPDWDEDEHE